MLEASGSEGIQLNWLSDDTAQIDARLDPYLYSIRMLGCNAEAGCDRVLIFSTFRVAGYPDLAAYQKVNHYNDTIPFGRAFLLEPAPEEDTFSVGVDYALDLTHETRLDAADMDKFIVIVDSFVARMNETDEE